MKVVPVLDLQGGVVVRGVAGRREEYRPIQSQLVATAEPAAVAAALARAFAPEALYVADLDAIAGQPPQIETYAALARSAPQLWIDAGAAQPAAAAKLIRQLDERAIDAQLIQGLESVADPVWLAEFVSAVGADRAIFSLDLKAGRPITRVPAWQELPPLALARRAAEAGFGRLIVLDLAQVGVGAGVGTLPLCRALQAEFPGLAWIAGGGVRSLDDLRELAAHGCTAALVASALHDGRLTPADLAALRREA